MSALAQCDAFAFIYDQAGDPAPDVLVVLKRVIDAGGNPILLGPKTTTTDSAGSFHFTLPELSTAFISARASALWNCPDGRAFTVPPGPSGELVPDFSLPASTLVEPPLVYVGDVLSIPKASETQDGYLSAADFVAFEAGAAMGVNEILTGPGLTGGPITDTGTISLAPISGVAGTWENPSSITINAYGQIIAITGVADTTPPAISGVNVSSLAPTAATIEWFTDDPSDSQVEYTTTTFPGTLTPITDASPAPPVTHHIVSIGSLTASQLYNFHVKSRNTAHLLTTSADFTFTTTAAPDTTAPGISAVMAVSITDNAATIQWTTNESSTSQVFYGTTTSYGTSTPITNTPVSTAGTLSHSVTLTGLTPSTPYHYHVRSQDAVPNVGDSLTSLGDLTFTTLGAPADLLTGLVSYWKMDALAAGVTPDVLGFNDFSVAQSGTGSVTLVTSALGLGSEIRGSGTAGSGQTSLFCGDHSSQHFAGSFSIAGWLTIHVLDGSQIHTLIAKWDVSVGTVAPDLYAVWYNEFASKWQFAISDGITGPIVEVTAAPVANTPYFIVATYDAAAHQIGLSINGATPAVMTFAGPLNTSAAAGLSSIYPGTNISNCSVDEVGMWGKALSTDEIAALYNGGAGKTHPFT